MRNVSREVVFKPLECYQRIEFEAVTRRKFKLCDAINYRRVCSTWPRENPFPYELEVVCTVVRMNQRPYIDNAHPQYRIYTYPDFIEHRIENWHLARDGSGRVVRHDAWTLTDALVAAILAVSWAQVVSHYSECIH